MTRGVVWLVAAMAVCVLMLLGTTHAQQVIDCKYTDAIGRKYDFSPLANNTGDYAIRSGASEPAVIVEFNLCRTMVAHPQFYGAVDSDGKPSSLGDKEAISDLPNGAEGGLFNITDGIVCRGSASGKTSASILVICDPTAETPRLDEPVTVGGCAFQVSVYSKHGCATGSLAWLFPTIFLSVLALYFVVGAVYRTQFKKKEFSKAIPHRKFWGALPGLVADGCKFSARKVLSPCGVTIGEGEETEKILP
eukprot:TRINITY_DN7009_c0_g4_i1.p1 TRINITY_DN7009_c0_g4~~TRINITY_DN7009_c0_g4_i1.p1  ORF type:complete len:249 (-),score=29.29 TRINITY_DN7009_c0_g4_i1:74-820(-)